MTPKSEEQILNEVVNELQPGGCMSGEIEWDTCIEAMKRFNDQFKPEPVPVPACDHNWLKSHSKGMMYCGSCGKYKPEGVF